MKRPTVLPNREATPGDHARVDSAPQTEVANCWNSKKTAPACEHRVRGPARECAIMDAMSALTETRTCWRAQHTVLIEPTGVLGPRFAGALFIASAGARLKDLASKP